MRKYLVLTFCTLVLFFTGTAFAQEIEITGTVKSEPDQGTIPGVNVLVKGTNIGTVTNLDGKYTIRVPDTTGILVFSFLGMETQEVKVGPNTIIDITLSESIAQINEVVVTALGIKRESKTLGYSVSEVSTEQMVQARDANLMNTISGKVAGLQISQTAGGVGSSSRIVIRGVSLLSNNNQPLIVVDGIPIDNTNHDTPTWLGGHDYGSGISDINPDDIENISILKGPNAAALYGSKANNGVIMITTKSGKKGQKRANISFSQNTTFDRAYLMAKYQNEYGLGYGGAIQRHELTAAQKVKYGRDTLAYSYGTGSWGPKMAGQEILNWNGKITKVTPQPNNVKDYFEQGYTATSTLAVDGSFGEKSSYRLSYVDLRNKGISPNSTYTRNTINFRSVTEVTKKLDFDFKVNYIYEKALNRTGVGDARTGARTFIWMPRSTNINELKDYYKDENGTEMNWYEPDPWHTNPYWESYKNTNYDNKDRVIGSATINYSILPGLRFTLRGGTDFYKSRRYMRIANKSLREPKGSYTERWIAYRSMNYEGFFSLEKKISEDFSINMIAGATTNSSEVDMNSSTVVDLAIPDFFSLNNGKDKANYTIGTTLTRKKLNAIFSSAEIGFRNFWFVDVTARNDWSSTLPASNNSYFYPSVNTSLILTEIIKDHPGFWDFGKIRLSWAKVGNDPEPYKLYNTYTNEAYSSYPTNYITGVRKQPDLKPEESISSEVGGDFRFFSNRVGIDFSLYKQSTKNQILKSELSKTTGFGWAMINAGEVQNKGIELLLTLKPIRTTVIDWAVTFNYAKNVSEVVSLAPGIETHRITEESQMYVEARPGHPYGDIIGSTVKRFYLKDSKGKIIPDKRNGMPLLDASGLYMIDTDWKVIGNVTPDWTGGIVNEFAYKNFSLSFTIGIKIGGDIFSKTNKYGLDNGQFVETLKGRASWYAATTEEQLKGRKGLYNPDGTPMVNEDGDQMFAETSSAVGYVTYGVYDKDSTINTIGMNPQSYWHQYKWGGIGELSVYDASYVKLREVIIGFNLPKTWLNKGFIKAASVSLVGRNLWLIYSGTPNIDPEVSFSSQENGLGQEYASLPTLRSFGFNINVNF